MAIADPNGFLFVTDKGSHKAQDTLALQITAAIAEHVGIHMTPHQFRHFAACLGGFTCRGRSPKYARAIPLVAADPTEKRCPRSRLRLIFSN